MALSKRRVNVAIKWLISYTQVCKICIKIGILTVTSMHLTSQQAPNNPRPDTIKMKTPITINNMAKLSTKSPSL